MERLPEFLILLAAFVTFALAWMDRIDHGRKSQ